MKQLYKMAWRYYSLVVRTREKGICYTCNRRNLIQSSHAGHYVHGGNNAYSYYLDFDDRNIHCQCIYCNHYIHGNLEVYQQKLIKQYGPDVIDELKQAKWKSGGWGNEDLVKIIEGCKIWLKENNVLY